MRQMLWTVVRRICCSEAQEIDSFFTAYPNVLHCLTKLSLKNVGFDKWDMHHLLFDCCKQLKHLALYHCDIGANSVFKIDAPNSKLLVLELIYCRFELLELVCLPKLEKLTCSTWLSRHAPLAFDFVPSLGELKLSSALTYYNTLFKLSELLHGGACIRTLTLDFKGENVSCNLSQPSTRILFPFCVHYVFIYDREST